MDVRASNNDLELWHVQLGGVVRTMTLDELDNAFQSGVIDENTNVLKAGAVRWTTLGDVAGLDDNSDHPSDDQPNSIAPMATDIYQHHSANFFGADSIPPNPPNFDFDASFGTEELAVFKPKRNVGRAFAVVAVVCALGGGLFAVKSYGTAGIRAKAAQVASLVKKKPAAPQSGAMAAAAVAPPPAAMDPPRPTVSINSLPAAGALAATNPPPPPPDKNADKNAKKKAEKEAAKAKAAASTVSKKKSAANDPTQKGTGQFDPLNGNL